MFDVGLCSRSIVILSQGGEGHLVVHVGGGVGAAAAAATAVLKQNVKLNEGNERNDCKILVTKSAEKSATKYCKTQN